MAEIRNNVVDPVAYRGELAGDVLPQRVQRREVLAAAAAL
jgi:hypothetical protein